MPLSLVGALALIAASGSVGDARPLAPAAPPAVPLAAPLADAAVRYSRDIRPLLSDRCFTCHGPDDKKRRGKLRLDEAAGAFAERESGAAIVPGDPDASELLARIGSDSPKHVMPPPSSNKKPLDAEEQELLRRWIEQGAVYEPHWAFVAPQRPRLPAVARGDAIENAIDTFIVAKLESEGVAPGPRADKESQLRRLFLALTGLPPTPEEQEQFLADARPDAYARQVDRLFAEEPWKRRSAEHLATPWLDAARYADTSGIHTDAGRQIWPWRDWLLGALRDNLPFDRFVTEQLAGDLLPNATLEQRVASGFHRNHVTTDEGGAIAEEYLVEYAVDRTATTGSVFLALTLGCARCHDHKYDPITQRDFYGLLAFFNSIEEPGLYSQLPDPNRAFEPALPVPSAAQQARLAALEGELAAAEAALQQVPPEEQAQEAQFLAEKPVEAGISFAASEVVGAEADGGVTLEAREDGSFVAGGANPATTDYRFVLRTEASGLNLLRLDALADAALHGRVGRAPNGNAVVSGIALEAVSRRDPTQRAAVRFQWAWADVEQENGDYRVVNVLDTEDDLGWALAGHQRPGSRVALLLAEQPFGFEGGSDLHVTLQFRSVYAQHTLGRVRLAVGSIGAAGRAMLPAAASGWYRAGPFTGVGTDQLYATAFGPESAAAFDFRRPPVEGGPAWRYDVEARDGRVNDLPGGTGATYLARRLFVPTDRSLEVSLGSDDSFRLFVDGVEVAGRNVDRGAAPDQDRATIALKAGLRTIVLKIGNTGGPGSFYWRALDRDGELVGGLVAALLPEAVRSPELAAQLHEGWKQRFSTGYRERTERVAAVQRERAQLLAGVPQTMVMSELAAPRPTYVLLRGEYDKPDREQPITRAIPAALGALPAGASRDRLGLAQWLTSPTNPLLARVAVNRWWEMLFGTGIVATSEDFGLQGEFPSHPELLDWLAVELRESGWDVQHVLKLMVNSATFRQSAQARPAVREIDPGNRWLSWFPRRRLTAEQLRDQALHVAGLLVEKVGGPSVKPYQPDGLWNEVAMPASNTRTFVRGEGEQLWRRSLYTYWKRACPPPSLQTFDAPTREFCTIRRTSTSTPLQALVLWNDEQFVEAARALAQRTLREPGDDAARVTQLHRRCTGRPPEARERERLLAALGQFRARYSAAPADGEALLSVGMAPREATLPVPELAAWTLLASAVLQLDATIAGS
ncbi:MAG: DUF1553 domain-containing protein [Planctomycetes bacterium]|nr:DUF1553 domain-containing protein [Planctomycetota bacterium]